jgi:hypothetical protein
MKQKFKLYKGDAVKVTKSKALVDVLKGQGWVVDEAAPPPVRATRKARDDHD